MKRAKIFLTAITVLTVAGGALAFKAHNAYLGALKCGTVQNQCNVVGYVASPIPTTTIFCTPTSHVGTDCTLKYQVIANF